MNKTCVNCVNETDCKNELMCWRPQRYCATCWYNENDFCMRQELFTKISDEDKACNDYLLRPPFAVIDNSMGYVQKGESWFSKEEFPGWYDKLLEVEREIQYLIDTHPAAWFKVQQFKEKYGSARTYFTADDSIYEEVYELIDDLETWTEKHCYHCGKPATKMATSWITFLCDDCAAKETGIVRPIKEMK